METLDLSIHDPEEFEGKCITCNGCEYIIGSYIASGSFKIVHYLINKRSTLHVHVLLIFLGEPEIAVAGLEEEYNNLILVAPAFERGKIPQIPRGTIKLQGYGGSLAMQESLNTEAQEQEANSTYTLTKEADSLFSSSDWTGATSLYQQILDINPDHTHALNNLAYIQSTLGNWETAFSFMAKAIEIEPNYLPFHLNYIPDAVNCGSLRASINQFEQMKSVFPYERSLDNLAINLYLELGTPEKAIPYIDQAIKLSPKEASDYVDRGHAHYRLQNYKQAIADYDHAIALDPSHTDAYTDRGTAFYAIEEYQRAVEDYNRAIDLDINKPTGSGFFENDGSDTSASLLGGGPLMRRSLLKKATTESTVYWNRGLAYEQLSAYQQALEDYNHALVLDPTDARLYWRRGSVYSQLGEFQQAIENYDHALALAPDDHSFHTKRALAYYHLKNYQKAIEDYNCALGLNPTDAVLYIGRGLAYEKWEKYRYAMEDYNRALALKPDDPSAYMFRGRIHGKLQEYKQAVDDYNHVLALEPNDVGSYLNRGFAYVQLEAYQQAINDYAQALVLEPEDAEIYLRLGSTYHQLEKYEQAIDNYNRAIALDPDNTEAYFNRGATFSALKEYQRALEDYDRAIKLDPNDPTTYRNRGLAHAKLSAYQQAIENFSHTLALDPTDAQAYFYRGQAYENLGKYQQATEDYNHAIALDPRAIASYPARTLQRYSSLHPALSRLALVPQWAVCSCLSRFKAICRKVAKFAGL